MARKQKQTVPEVRHANAAPDEPRTAHRLDGLEPDNLLAFLALLGLLRALEAARFDWRPRARWDVAKPPLRPVLVLRAPQTRAAVAKAAAEGCDKILSAIDLTEIPDVKMPAAALRAELKKRLESKHFREDLSLKFLSAIFCEFVSREKDGATFYSPLCFPSVARVNFLKSVADIAASSVPERRARDPHWPSTAEYSIAQSLYAPWRRLDRPPGLRWDPEEAKRHAYQWNAPTDVQPTSQHGANRLALVGFSDITVAPNFSRGATHLRGIGLGSDRGDDALYWPIWKEPATASAIRALMSRPRASMLEGMAGDWRAAKQISVARFASWARAEVMPADEEIRRKQKNAVRTV